MNKIIEKHVSPEMPQSEKSKRKNCRFVEIKNVLSLLQNVAPFLSVFSGCQFSGTRLSLHFLTMSLLLKVTPFLSVFSAVGSLFHQNKIVATFFSNVACPQYLLEGLNKRHKLLLLLAWNNIMTNLQTIISLGSIFTRTSTHSPTALLRAV